MLFMTYGDAEEAFSGMNDELKDNFMWACSDIADECFALSETISTTVHRHIPNTPTTADTKSFLINREMPIMITPRIIT
jgi:hypothetical protein